MMDRRSFLLRSAPALLAAAPALATSVCTLQAGGAPLPAVPEPRTDILNISPFAFRGDRLLEDADPNALALARLSLANLVTAMEGLSVGYEGWHVDLWGANVPVWQGIRHDGPTVRATVARAHQQPFHMLPDGQPIYVERRIVMMSDKLCPT